MLRGACSILVKLVLAVSSETSQQHAELTALQGISETPRQLATTDFFQGALLVVIFRLEREPV